MLEPTSLGFQCGPKTGTSLGLRHQTGATGTIQVLTFLLGDSHCSNTGTTATPINCMDVLAGLFLQRTLTNTSVPKYINTICFDLYVTCIYSFRDDHLDWTDNQLVCSSLPGTDQKACFLRTSFHGTKRHYESFLRRKTTNRPTQSGCL